MTDQAPSQTPTDLPFKSRCSPAFISILEAAQSSIAFSTYQSGKVVLLSVDNGRLIQLPRDFTRPMGLIAEADRMAVATRDEIVILGDARGLAPHYPGNSGVYDHLLTPRASLYTSPIDTHDLAWSGDVLYGVNTRFSCLCTFGDRYSFVPVWQPGFITDLMPEDRCHLNGVAMDQGAPAFVTALGTTNTPRGWHDGRATGGVLMHVPSSEVVLDGLSMPHSPRLIDGQLFVLNSGTGELLKVDPERGNFDVLCSLPGFARGLARLGDYLVVGLSTLRDKKSFGGLPLGDQADDLKCGVALVNAKSGELAALFYYETDCEELYDVQVLAGMRRPGIIGVSGDLHRSAMTTPEFVGWTEIRKPEQSKTEPSNPYTDAVRMRQQS